MSNSNTFGISVSCADGFELSLEVCSASIAGTTVNFTALADLCITDGVQTGLTGGSPTGGTYSGPGVTDGGNGMTYSFDPAAGVGTHTLTYTNGSSATDDVVVFGTGAVSFTTLADVCIDAGDQNNLGGGSPAGGVYSGPGVTDDGNGMTYDFDPGIAGLGVHAITYMTASGCIESAMDNVEVLAACGCPVGQSSYFYCYGNFETNVVAFEVCPTAGMAAQATINIGTIGTPDDGLTIYQGATGSGTSGTLMSGPLTGNLAGTVITGNVADQCLIFVINSGPVGSCMDGFELGLNVCGESIATSAALTLSQDFFCSTDGTQTLGGGLAVGGVYSGTGVTYDGNGTTFTFDPSVVGAGVYTVTYTNGGGCYRRYYSDC